MASKRPLDKKVSSAACDWELILTCVFSELWRYTGPFTRAQRFKGAFPGFGIAVVAFAGYLVAEQVFFPPAEHGHGEDHGEGH